jgi:GT2 family glycosyltransferase
MSEQKVTIAILNYNGRNHLEETIQSIKALDYPSKRLLMVDDGSTDGSTDFVRINHPDVKIIEMGCNTKMLNRVRNRAISAADTDFILLTDNDITFAPDCLKVLMETMNSLRQVAVLTPRVMYHGDKTRIYIDRNEFHYVCASSDSNRDGTVTHITDSSNEPLRSFGCGIMLIDRTKASTIGFFDEDYVMGWGDDGEFHHRINISGLGCYAVPRALVYHKAIKGAPRVYGQIRNRWFLILQTYSWRTFFLTMPALLTYELCLFLFVAMKGFFNEYVKAMRDVVANYQNLMNKRKAVQAYKVVADKEVMTAASIFIPGTYKNNIIIDRAFWSLNILLQSYWTLVRRYL